MTLTLLQKINRELDRRKAAGETTFSPSDIGKIVGTDPKTVVMNFRGERDDVQLIQRAKGDGGHSIWAFREAEA